MILSPKVVQRDHPPIAGEARGARGPFLGVHRIRDTLLGEENVDNGPGGELERAGLWMLDDEQWVALFETVGPGVRNPRMGASGWPAALPASASPPRGATRNRVPGSRRPAISARPRDGILYHSGPSCRLRSSCSRNGERLCQACSVPQSRFLQHDSW